MLGCVGAIFGDQASGCLLRLRLTYTSRRRLAPRRSHHEMVGGHSGPAGHWRFGPWQVQSRAEQTLYYVSKVEAQQGLRKLCQEDGA